MESAKAETNPDMEIIGGSDEASTIIHSISLVGQNLRDFSTVMVS